MQRGEELSFLLSVCCSPELASELKDRFPQASYYHSVDMLPADKISFFISDDSSWGQQKDHIIYLSQRPVSEIEKLFDIYLERSYASFYSHLRELARKHYQNLPSKELNSADLELLKKFEMRLMELNIPDDFIAYPNIFHDIFEDQLLFLKPLSFTDDENRTFLVLGDDEEGIVYFWKPEIEHLILSLHDILENWWHGHQLRRKIATEVEESKDLIDTASFPIFVIDSQEQILFYNKKFSELGVTYRELKPKLRDERLEIDSLIYRYERKNLGDERQLVILYPLGENYEKSVENTPFELGVLTSSMAHELNNPLAAIMAALSVLELDEWPEDSIEEMQQMSLTVKRCKKMVETFLGFSRILPSARGVAKEDSILECFERAMELLRFRMIKEDMTFEVEKNVSSRFSMPINPSLMTMFFYIFLGEFLTAWQHLGLIKQSSSFKAPQIKLDIHKDIIFTWQEKLDLKASLQKNKLIVHIAQVNNFMIKIDHTSIVISTNDEEETGKVSLLH